MQLGDFLLWLAMAGTVIAAVAYIGAGRGRAAWISLARASYYAMATATVAVSAYLMALIWQGRFDVSYVHAYTSLDLEPVYKISAFWAGQEGSFLLWALFGAFLGLVLIHKGGKYEPWLMGFWSIVQAFLFTLLLVKSPFVPTLELVPNAALHDGSGLNPLLQNPWMAMHPPLIFLGYAAMAVPAGFVIAALFSKDYDLWARDSLPWTLFAWITLGAGIFVGGYWAYEVLGWGGYWAWDPVENASLVPWLTGTALLHGLLVERSRGTLRRTNVVMALLSFLLIIYATFLTRSGVLGDFSVHSFSDLGVNGYLIGFMAFFALLSVSLYIWRAKEIRGGPAFASAKSKEFAFYIGIIVLTISAALIIIGTSSPIYTRWMGDAQSVDASFYIRTNTPVAIILLALMALAPLLAWGGRLGYRSDRQGLAWTTVALAASLIVALLVGAITAMQGEPARALPAAAKLAVGLAAVISLVVNGAMAIMRGRLNIRAAGGVAAHAGIALMFIGILLSSSGGESKKLVLSNDGQPELSHGYTFSYLGKEQLTPNKEALKIQVKGRGVDYIARPTLQLARDGMMRSPAIHKKIANDLYLAPIQDSAAVQMVLIEGKPYTLHGVEFEFVRFVVGGPHTMDSLDVGAEIRIRENSGESLVTPRLLVQGDRRTSVDAEVPGADVRLSLLQMSVEERAVQVNVLPRTDSVVIEVSEKPWISLLWIGAILALVGGSIAMWRRSCEGAKTCVAEDLPAAETEQTVAAEAQMPLDRR